MIENENEEMLASLKAEAAEQTKQEYESSRQIVLESATALGTQLYGSQGKELIRLLGEKDPTILNNLEKIFQVVLKQIDDTRKEEIKNNYAKSNT